MPACHSARTPPESAVGHTTVAENHGPALRVGWDAPRAGRAYGAGMTSSSSKLRVLVVGGGVAGVEALLALHDLAAGRVELTLLAASDDFVYRPMAVAEPFALGHARRHALQEICPDAGAAFVRGAVARVDDANRAVVTVDGERHEYDALLIAVGARTERALERGLTWRPEGDPELFGGLLRDIEEGYSKRIAFVVPNEVAWPLPAYELALMTAHEAKGMGRDDVEVIVVTPEHAPLGIFGDDAARDVAALLEDAGVRVELDAHAKAEAGRGGAATRLVLGPGRTIDVDRVVALPRAVGPGIEGVATDARGFIVADRHGKVDGAERVWAAGDGIAFPIKQGGLAAQQADAAAESIAALAGADVEPKPFHPILRGMLLTGGGRRWLRHDIAGAGDEAASGVHALWWPPTKIAGRYLSPYLAARDEGATPGEAPVVPDGHAVELDLHHEVADAR
jgi:sulfide:quinone oxidoreductase